MLFEFDPIGFIRSDFKEKFGVPRQSMMMTEARGILKLNNEPKYREAIEDLEKFSHLWLIFVFHKELDKDWRAKISPPRTELNQNVGVFSSRSPHRPNPIGISALKIERIDSSAEGGAEIHLSGLDILDGTPVLDIKPYIPYADSIPQANSGWADAEIKKYTVSFATDVEIPKRRDLLIQMLELDPRPTSQRRNFPIEDERSEDHPFAFRFLDYDVQWKICKSGIHVVKILKLVEKC